jgi:hypothetical protein
MTEITTEHERSELRKVRESVDNARLYAQYLQREYSEKSNVADAQLTARAIALGKAIAYGDMSRKLTVAGLGLYTDGVAELLTGVYDCDGG